MSLVRADGLVTIPRFCEGLDAGQEVLVELWRSPDSLAGTIVVIGSHDLTLDLLASELRRGNPDLTLASSNVGSLGGLLALQRGEAHLAGTHLLDETTGEYNLSFIRRYVQGRAVVVVNLVQRVQGFIVPPGNPRSITTLADLRRDGITFVNRQRGSGTRVLLDYLLTQQAIAPTQIAGYEREEYTHLAVAAAVAGGRVAVGLGVLSAARALGMDFVPLQNEQYDLVIPREFYDSDLLQPAVDTDTECTISSNKLRRWEATMSELWERLLPHSPNGLGPDDSAIMRARSWTAEGLLIPALKLEELRCSDIVPAGGTSCAMTALAPVP